MYDKIKYNFLFLKKRKVIFNFLLLNKKMVKTKIPITKKKCLMLVPAVVIMTKKNWKKCDQKMYVFFHCRGGQVIAGPWLMPDALDRIDVRKATDAETDLISREIL